MLLRNLLISVSKDISNLSFVVYFDDQKLDLTAPIIYDDFVHIKSDIGNVWILQTHQESCSLGFINGALCTGSHLNIIRDSINDILGSTTAHHFYEMFVVLDLPAQNVRFGDQNKKDAGITEEATKKIKQLELTQNKHEKLIDSLIKTNDQLYKDALNQKDLIDSMMENLTKRDESIKDKAETIRTGSATDFISDDGSEVLKGYYVIVGSFAVQEYAKRFKNELMKEGYSQTKSIQRNGSEIKNVYVFYTDDINEAINEKRKFTNIDESVWVLRID